MSIAVAAEPTGPVLPPTIAELAAIPSNCLRTKKQIAAHCQVSERTIDAWMQARRIPYLKLGKLVRFRLADVDSHFDDHHRIDRVHRRRAGSS